ncbi:DUF2625 family protein [Kibdelosporangium phytohabitans]|uniref:DUF2625 domain-containing protein n=1 Tax=Kibdelosporangium phytohabitans TaxID=860235 RepID=A0A0N9I5P7_9PSEU|nr:DUF2625 family protein [Kibdelosporangium phytohabitans]ALG10982.1 hypothetical protein AOZ06_32500 [Kibdelosporangium phytohabitans]MBE1462193.1 hypothetical protein [Kibdelosporangium phytohabitans]
MNTSAWDEITAAIASAPYPVTVVPADPRRAEDCLGRLGITTNSWLGAVVRHSGGLLVDHGWLRVLGSGTHLMPEAGRAAGGVAVGHDVLGGRFVWIPTGNGPTVHYYAPDTLEWEDLEVGYADWLDNMLAGSLTAFYADLRWPGWADEVAAIQPDKGIHTWPPPSTVEGKDLAKVSRTVVPMTELIGVPE